METHSDVEHSLRQGLLLPQSNGGIIIKMTSDVRHNIEGVPCPMGIVLGLPTITRNESGPAHTSSNFCPTFLVPFTAVILISCLLFALDWIIELEHTSHYLYWSLYYCLYFHKGWSQENLHNQGHWNCLKWVYQGIFEDCFEIEIRNLSSIYVIIAKKKIGTVSLNLQFFRCDSICRIAHVCWSVSLLMMELL